MNIMNNNFCLELQAIVDRLHPSYRPQVQEDIDFICQTGVSSYDNLLAVLQDKNPQIVTIACFLLGRLGNKKAIPKLIPILKHKNPNLREVAARALGDLDAKEATEQLIATLIIEENIEVSIAIVFALGLLGETQAFEILVSILEDQTKNTKIRGMAAEALADLRDKRAVIPLIIALQDPSVEVRFWAAFSLGELGDPQALPTLKQLADKDQGILLDWGTVRDEALTAIQSIQEKNVKNYSV